ncbi:hypothetical protein HN011_000565, partial [Eciton burchellii]
ISISQSEDERMNELVPGQVEPERRRLPMNAADFFVHTCQSGNSEIEMSISVVTIMQRGIIGITEQGGGAYASASVLQDGPYTDADSGFGPEQKEPLSRGYCTTRVRWILLAIVEHEVLAARTRNRSRVVNNSFIQRVSMTPRIPADLGRRVPKTLTTISVRLGILENPIGRAFIFV